MLPKLTNARDGETPRPNETELVAGPADRATMVEALALFAQGLESTSIQETFLEYGWGLTSTPITCGPRFE